MESTAETTMTEGIGAQVLKRGVRYRVWAPDHDTLAVVVNPGTPQEHRVPLTRESDGFFAAVDEQGAADDLYLFELSDGNRYPDPASRFQPYGVHGPSQCVDPRRYTWKTPHWRRPAWRGQTIYELHVGTFTEAGTFRAAAQKLDHLAELGVDAIELMPIADFPGERNWGYDGVALYAPARCYGPPDDLRALVDAAHARGLLVILDVVYNHLGPSGNYLSKYAQSYFHRSHHTPWGTGFNLDGPESRPVRDFFVNNAAYWMDDYKIDGLRLDATHAIEDRSETHLLSEIAQAVHARRGFVIAEDERNTSEVLSLPDGSGHKIDAVWSDDFHHQLRVALTGVREGYFGAYAGTVEALAQTIDHGWYYTGQEYPFWGGRSRGQACRHLPPTSFIYCVENHDQVGNRALGERLEHLVDPALFRAATALLCLSPYVPLLFMGQEWAATAPFQYFTHHEGDLGRLVSEGRKREMSAAGLFSVDPARVPDPEAESTFVRSKLDWRELQAPRHQQVFAFCRECLRLRRTRLRAAIESRNHWLVVAVDKVLVLRYEPEGRKSILVLVTLSAAMLASVDTHIVFAPPDGCRWVVALNSEAAEFGGGGAITGTAVASEARPGEPWIKFYAPGAVVLVSEDF